MVHKYLPRNKPEFVHVDKERLEEMLTTAEAGGRGREIEEETVQQGNQPFSRSTHFIPHFRGLSGTDRERATRLGEVVDCRGRKEQRRSRVRDTGHRGFH